MAFNHYAKMKHILEQQPGGWVIKRIDAPTSSKNFKGEIVNFDHYYRIYSNDDQPIKYCKFQQTNRLAQVLNVAIEELPLLN